MTAEPDTNTPLGDGAEFDVVRELVAVWGDVARGIGDDAAVLRASAGMQLVVSTDACVEDVHFRRRWLSPGETGHRAAMAALSDLAAMGARPDAMLVSLVVPPVWRPHLREFAAGLGQAAQSCGAKIVGGNLARGGTFSCTLTVLGWAHRPVLRSGGSPGNVLCVTGTLGGPGTALDAWEAAHLPAAWARERFAAPVARVAQGQWLEAHGATAMIDISDGLAADSRHLAAASGVACVIDAERVPRFAGVTAERALSSGEEYELLVALPPDRAGRVCAEFTATFGLPLTPIGRMEPRASASSAAPHGDPDGVRRVEIADGHDHFSKQ